MTETKSSRDQLKEWVGQLAPEHRRELLEILAEDEQLARESRYELAVDQLRRMASERGAAWDAMNPAQQEEFLERLLREDLGATNIGPPPQAVSLPAPCPACGRDMTPSDLYRIFFSHRQPTGQRMAACLVLFGGEKPETKFPIQPHGETVIGRLDPHRGIRPDIDLSQYDIAARVSRRHARIIARDDQFFIEDLGSSNGTVINGRVRLTPQSLVQLSPGDTIRIGQTVLKFTTR
jgi:hypothetical protein